MLEKKPYKIPYIKDLNNFKSIFKEEEETITSYTLEKSNSQFTLIGILLTELIQLELNKIPDTDKLTIIKFLNELCIVRNLFGIFNIKTLIADDPNNDKNLVDTIFKNNTLTEFILNITDRFSVYIYGENIDYEWIIETIASGVTLNKKTINEENLDFGSLIPNQIFDSVFITNEEIIHLLEYNAWLTVIYLIHIFDIRKYDV